MNLAFDCQVTTFVTVQHDSLIAEFFFQNNIFSVKGLNDFLLLPIDPTGNDDHDRRRQLQYELHKRLGMAKDAGIIPGERK
jgi:hypothetical protein